MKYEVWYEPTEKGKALGWKEKKISGPYDSKDVAELDAYINGKDDPAPDAREYARYVVRKVTP